MPRAKINRGPDPKGAQQVISTAVDAAEAVIMGVGRVAERAIAETTRAAEDVRAEIGATLARIKESARKVSTSADGRGPKATAKARGGRRRRPSP